MHTFHKERNVSYSGNRKGNLIDLCKACENIKLPSDPDYNTYNNKKEVSQQLDYLKLENPSRSNMKDEHFANDLSLMPMIGLLDIFHYIFESRADYDKKKLKGCKSAEDYRLFVDGHVEDLSFNNNKDHQYCVVKSKVKPT